MTFQLTDVTFSIPESEEIGGLFKHLCELAAQDAQLEEYRKVVADMDTPKGPAYTPTVSFTCTLSAAR
jgi:hypothetical protein